MKCDYVIKNGTIIDPKNKRSTVANMGISDGKISVITRENIDGENILNATGKIVCPGIIDIHTHVEGNEDCAKLMNAMGVTTVYNGNCGMSPENLKGFLDKQDKQGFLINQIEQVGHTTLRESVGLFDRYREADLIQIEKMKELAEEAFNMVQEVQKKKLLNYQKLQLNMVNLYLFIQEVIAMKV